MNYKPASAYNVYWPAEQGHDRNLIVNICSVPPHQKIRHSHHAMKTNALTLDGWRFYNPQCSVQSKIVKKNQHLGQFEKLPNKVIYIRIYIDTWLVRCDMVGF